MQEPESEKIIEKVQGVQGMTSLEAAALVASDGQTTDPELASQMATGQVMDMDKMQKAHLRRMMGFDFQIKYTHAKVYAFAKDGSKVSAQGKINAEEDLDADGFLNETGIEKLVQCCIKLKSKHTAELRRRARLQGVRR